MYKLLTGMHDNILTVPLTLLYMMQSISVFYIALKWFIAGLQRAILAHRD